MISVVIPVYNQERYIKETIESVLCQADAEYEVIVVNDGSTDKSLEIIKDFRERIILIDQKNEGVAKARNAGVRSARGELIAFLDGDDRYIAGHLREAERFARLNPDAVLFYGDARVIDEDGEKLWVQRAERSADFERLLIRNFIISSSVIVRKKVFENGIWFEDYHPCEDWDFWLRAIELGGAMHYPWVGVEYRKHKESAIKSKRILASEMSLKVLERALARHPGLSDKIRNFALANVYYESMVRFLASSETREARENAIMCLRKNPKMLNAWAGLFLSVTPRFFLRVLIEVRRELKKWLS